MSERALRLGGGRCRGRRCRDQRLPRRLRTRPLTVGRQLGVIGALCPWCLVADLLTGIVAAFALMRLEAAALAAQLRIR